MNQRGDEYPIAQDPWYGVRVAGQPEPDWKLLVARFLSVAEELDDGAPCFHDQPIDGCLIHSGGNPCEIDTLRKIVADCHLRPAPCRHETIGTPLEGNVRCRLCGEPF